MIDFRAVDEWHIGNNEVVEASLNGTVVWSKPASNTIPFYVENITNSNETLSIKRHSNAPSIIIEKSTDHVNWTEFGTTSTTALTYTLTPGSKLYLRANTNAWGSMTSGGSRANNFIRGISRVGGNIMSLLYGSNFTGNEVLFPSNTNNIFSSLFSENGESSHNLQDASKLILPATTLTERCYDGMFDACTLLTNSAELPATTLVKYCYRGMFAGCTSLSRIKCLATNISATDCTSMWVYGVASSGTFIKNASMSSWGGGDDGIPSGWTVIDA